MDPCYRPGDTLECEPVRSPRPDQDYLMETGTGARRRLVLVRVYGMTDSTWLCLTYTPARLLRLSRRTWRPVFRISAMHVGPDPRPASKWDGVDPEPRKYQELNAARRREVQLAA
jgi:hypothetical protein